MAKILIVDDSKLILEMTKNTLAAEKHQIITAQDGVMALELAKQEKPDLIILDVMLPNMNGYQICNLLKKDDSYKEIPIIMFSAKMGEEDKKIGQEAGAYDYIIKNFEPAQLIEVVNKHLKK